MNIQVGFSSDLSIDPSVVQDFYRTHWLRKIALSDDAFYRWQFISPPSNELTDSCVIAITDGKIIGVMGLNKRDFFLSDKKRHGAELTTWVVDKSVKGGGVGAKILRFILDNFEVLIGMGISEEALPIYLRLGFRYLQSIPRFVRVIDAESILPISKYADYARKIINRQLPSFETIDFECVEWRNATSTPKITGNHFLRDLENLVWRYEDHPYFHYYSFRVEALKGSGRYAYVILREEVTDDVRMLHVVDLLGDEESFRSAIKFVEYYAKKNKFWAVDCYSTLASLNKYFLSMGWLSTVDDTFISVPHLFHPLEVRTPATTSLIYWSKDSFNEMCDISKLYITKQDADLDRPTANYIEGAK